jgi:peptide/nickel transport system substrate-binding protein
MPRARRGTTPSGSNGRFNELLVAARAELDEDKRREMYYEMQAILRR